MKKIFKYFSLPFGGGLGRGAALLFLIGALVSCDTPETIPHWYPRYVEPRIGTAHCRYFHFAPGAMPFGMAKPGPSTNGHLGNKDGWEATGYDYRDGSIEGFPCTSSFRWAALC